MNKSIANPSVPDFGAFVVSLDFELHWGVRDRSAADGAYRANLFGAREAIRQMLDLFERYEIAATWATVGFLFASSARELKEISPKTRPEYDDSRLDPYAEQLGENEGADPLHFAPSLIRLIQQTPRQEIATHTFSHYYCTADGQMREEFDADLAAAVAVAERRGLRTRSIVFPRNRRNPEYDSVLIEHGIRVFRGNPRNWMWSDGDLAAPRKRIGRLLDAYANLGGHATTPWSEVLQPNGLSNVPSSCPLRPHGSHSLALHRLHVRRIRRRMHHAAKHREIFHLWWHPHTIGRNIDKNLRVLERILQGFDRCRDRFGMRSMSMIEVDGIVRGAETSDGAGGHVQERAPALVP